jgi:signal transduction histidine kinase/Tfp pilus assembly protein PilF
LQLSRATSETSPAKAEEYGRLAIHIAQKVGDMRQLAKAYRYVGTSYLGRSDYARAFALYDSSRRVAEHIGDEEALSAIWANMGIIFDLQGDFARALEYALRALRIDERLGRKDYLANSFLNIGTLYVRQKEFDTALEYYERSITMSRALGQRQAVGEVLYGIGRVWKDRRGFAKAHSYFDSALTTAREFGNQRLIGDITHDIGSTYLFQADTKRAAPYLSEALRVRQSRQNKAGIAQTLSAFGTLYMMQHDLRAARRFYEQSLHIANELKLHEIQMKVLFHLGDVAKQEGRYKEALAYQSQGFAYKDSLFNNARSRDIGRLEMLHRVEQQDAENRLLVKERELQRANLARERILLWAVSFGFILSFVVGLLLWRSGKQQRLANTRLRRHQDLLEEQAREIESINTELQESNLRLLETNEQLQDANRQILEQADALQTKNTALERLDKEKNEFLGIAAHDLKNPLAAIRLSAELLDRFHERMDESEWHERLRHIANTVDRMMRIITDLLHSNALESGVMSVNLVQLSPGAILERLQADYEARAKAKSLTLRIESHSQILAIADETMLFGVLENLLSNALKFSPPNTTITLRVEASVPVEGSNESTCRISVQDEGPGISDEDKQKLFGKFVRLSARPTGGEHSTGLGLSIVKKLVEAMNGRVWCESDLGKGATFIVELPSVR